MRRSRSLFAFGGTLLVLLVWLAVTFGLTTFRSYRVGDLGSEDFVAYWSAFRLLVLGENPFDPVRMLEVQQSVGRVTPYPLLMWNPPWMAMLFAPVLILPFNLAALVWFVLNLFFIGGTAYLSWRACRLPESALLPIFFVAALNPPAWEVLRWGQLGNFIGFGLASAICAIALERDLLAGVFLLALTIKPHLVLPAAVFIGLWLLVQRRFRVIASALAALLFITGVSVLCCPRVLEFWIGSFSLVSGDVPIVRTIDLETPTVTSYLRRFARGADGSIPEWPLVVVPMLGVLGTILVLMRKLEDRGALFEYLPPVLCASLVFAPHGWFHDEAILATAQTMTIALSFRRSIDARGDYRNAKQVVIWFLALNTLTLLLGATVLSAQHHFVWYPGVVFVLWVLSRLADPRPLPH